MKRGDNRGLSDVVTTLLIVLLVLVAIGIIWVVVRNVVQQGSEQIDVSSRCIAVDLKAVSVVENATNPGIYAVTLKRNAGGDEIGGVKISLFNATENSGVLEFGAAPGELDTVTQTVNTGGNVTNANRLDYTAYFVDASGNEKLCSQTGTLNF